MPPIRILKVYFRSKTLRAATVCDHASFRSYYFPVKNVIDRDLCKQIKAYAGVAECSEAADTVRRDATAATQKSIAEELDRTPAEVSKKLEDVRTKYRDSKFINGRCYKAHLMKRNPSKVTWTILYHRKHRKDLEEETAKKQIVRALYAKLAMQK